MLAMKIETEEAPKVQLNREDREALRLLRKADKLRSELKLVERDLNQAVIAFGQRRGYITGCYREYHMRSELRAKGVID